MLFCCNTNQAKAVVTDSIDTIECGEQVCSERRYNSVLLEGLLNVSSAHSFKYT